MEILFIELFPGYRFWVTCGRFPWKAPTNPILYTTVKFYGDSLKMCEDVQKFGDKRKGSYIMTMYRVTITFPPEDF
jgi:hypothetical protein